ncbi:MAG: substrate-binding domain-containing protein [Mesorhizobium sp.]|nr:substrate-binding domain-containing protein [Mesorhizobium sp.]MBL8579765.1 substrate-binding domain-containing protein [Mesorhizobium sp.]MCH2220887.1 substrate-binding domain-containing protein [Dechloromonas sp.]
MQIKKSVALCALALAGLAGQAHAAALTTAQKAVIDDANANNRILFISGASAVQKGFTGIISALIPGAKTFYTDKNGKDTAGKANTHSYEAVAGVLDSSAGGAWAGKNVILVYRVAGGSVWGVNPVARAQAIDSLNVSSTTCDDAGYAAADGSAANDKAFQCAKNTRVPDAGVSDVAPALFKQPLNTEGEIAAGQLNEAELAEFSDTSYNKPIYALAFGVPVTNNVNTALNRSAVAAIMAGNVGTWDAVNPALPADDIVVCRRVPGSGTQAVENLYFGNFPCGVPNTPADRTASEGTVFDAAATWSWTDANGKLHTGTGKYTIDPTAPTGGLVVIENSSSGNVAECMDAAVTGGKYVTKTRDGASAEYLVEFVNPGSKAIGVLSMDSLSKSKSTGNWQFRSLDGNGTYTWDNTAAAPVATGTGKHPTLANLIDGTWDMQGWISFNTPNRTVADAAKAPVLAKFLEKAQDPAILASISDLKNVAAAIPGGAYSGAQVLRVEYSQGNQCAPLNRNF